MSGADLIVLRCVAVADLPEPEPGSTQDVCAQCAVAVWVGPGALAHLARIEPEVTPTVLCVDCAQALANATLGGVAHAVLPADIEALLAELTPEEAAAIVAASTVTAPGKGVAKLLVALATDPDGELAGRYNAVYAAALVAVAGYQRRN